MSESIVIALLTLIGVITTSVMGYMGIRYGRRAAMHAKNADLAVNQVAPGEPKILDIVKDIRDSQQYLELKFDIKLDKIYQELTEKDSHFLNREEILRLWHEDHGQ